MQDSGESTDRVAIANYIVARLTENRSAMREQFCSPNRIPSCFLDDLLPADLAMRVYQRFPNIGKMSYKRSLREKKFIAAQMNEYDSILEECVYAFQDSRVVDLVGNITGLQKLEPDINLYAGGISVMTKGSYLRPHLDNSHDKDRERYRVLNLLFYVTPDWQQEFGGNFELWDHGPKGEPREIVSRFNRLVIMITNKTSWHSVNEVKQDQARCCVSNYYFSEEAAENSSYFHVTSFRGRPEEPVLDVVLQADGAARMGLRKVFKKGIVENPHVYKK